MSRAAFAGALAAGALVIALVQPSVARDLHAVKQRDDVFLVPPPKALSAMTLGYKAAVTDMLWAKLVLECGVHWSEKRPFPLITRYVDAILSLEPDFPTVYRFVDTMIVYGAETTATPDNVRLARQYLERGTHERPFDPEVWMQYGQFIAFLAPTYLKDEREIDRWRREGAAALARGVELGGDAQRSLAAASILDKAGERDATISFLQRAYAMTDDPDMRQQYLLRLQKLKATAESEQAISTVDREWQARYRFVSRHLALLVGPSRGAAECAGPQGFTTRGCASDWPAAVSQAR